MVESKHGEVKVIYSHASKGKNKVVELPEDGKLMRIEQVVKLTGLSKATVYRYVKEGTFPKIRKLGLKTTVFVRAEVEAWLDAVIAS